MLYLIYKVTRALLTTFSDDLCFAGNITILKEQHLRLTVNINIVTVSFTSCGTS